MAVSIKKIEIFNFRSIRNITLKPHDLSVLVGRNDAGKSNVLRALNLFFNAETEPGVPFDFTVDHNVDNNPNRKAKECRVRLELNIPSAYKDTNGDYIIWEKRWRESGEFLEKSGYWGVRDSEGPRGGRSLDYIDIPPRSNLHALLRNVNFVYVPAIKDKSYVARLRGQIYSVIAEVAADRFLASSAEFEQSISEHLQALTTEVSRTMGLDSRLALPRDLSHIFESLDFLNQDRSISLNQRGDGIKTRHIPVILKFMADKMHTLQGRGAQPYSFIWGYEEPENNQELASSIELADQLTEYLGSSISQVLITTHSPVFYNLNRDSEQNDPSISCHHVFWENEDGGTKQTPNPEDIDDYMGTMRLFAPYVEEVTKRVREEQKAIQEAQIHSENEKPHIYVEGKSDELIIFRSIQLFAPERADQIIVVSKESGGGHQYVYDMLSAWRHTHKHHRERPRAAGLVDADSPGNEVRVRWNEQEGNVQSAKCFKLPVPGHIVPAKKAGFNVPIVLESLYKREVWEREDEADNLENVNPADFTPNDLLRYVLLNGGPGIDEYLGDEWGIYVRKKVDRDRKVPLARWLSGKEDDDACYHLSEFQPLVNNIVSYLFGAES